MEGGHAPPPDAPVELHVDAAWYGGAAQRHVLVVRAEGGLAAGEEVGLGLLRHLVGPVVVDLVVVPDDQPRRGGVRGLQIRVGLVLRVPLPVVGQRLGLGALMVADVAAGDGVGVLGVLVLVVAQVQHEVRAVLGQAPVRGEVAVLVLGAGDERHGERPAVRQRVRRGPGPAGRRDVRSDAEAVPVLAVVGQALDLHVDAVTPLGRGHRHARAHHAAALGVGVHLPQHGERARGHAAHAVLGQRLRGQAGPDDEAAGVGIARGDAERERVGAQAPSCQALRGLCGGVGLGEGGGRGDGGDRARGQPGHEERSSVEVRHGSSLGDQG